MRMLKCLGRPEISECGGKHGGVARLQGGGRVGMDGVRKGELETDGYCLVRGVLNEESICSLRSMIDRELKSLPHMAHSEAMWKLRTLPEVRQLFEFGNEVYGSTECGPTFAKALAVGLSVNRTLTSLNIRSNNLAGWNGKYRSEARYNLAGVISLAAAVPECE